MPNPSVTPPPAEKPGGSTLYLVLWMVLGGIAAGYLVAALARPDIVAEYMPAFRQDSANIEVVEEVDSLRESVGQVQLDVAKLRVEVNAQDERGRDLDERVTVLETRPPLAAAAIESARTAHLRAPGALVAAGQEPPPEKETGSQEKLPAQKKADDKKAEKALETGSVEKAARAASKPAAKPAVRRTGVQIGAAASIDALRLSWLAISDRHGDTLKNLKARYVVGRDENGPVYKLIAGPVRNKSEGRKICDALSVDGVPCAVGTFSGNSL